MAACRKESLAIWLLQKIRSKAAKLARQAGCLCSLAPLAAAAQSGKRENG